MKKLLEMIFGRRENVNILIALLRQRKENKAVEMAVDALVGKPMIF